MASATSSTASEAPPGPRGHHGKDWISWATIQSTDPVMKAFYSIESCSDYMKARIRERCVHVTAPSDWTHKADSVLNAAREHGLASVYLERQADELAAAKARFKKKDNSAFSIFSHGRDKVAEVFPWDVPKFARVLVIGAADGSVLSVDLHALLDGKEVTANHIKSVLPKPLVEFLADPLVVKVGTTTEGNVFRELHALKINVAMAVDLRHCYADIVARTMPEEALEEPPKLQHLATMYGGQAYKGSGEPWKDRKMLYDWDSALSSRQKNLIRGDALAALPFILHNATLYAPKAGSFFGALMEMVGPKVMVGFAYYAGPILACDYDAKLIEPLNTSTGSFLHLPPEISVWPGHAVSTEQSSDSGQETPRTQDARSTNRCAFGPGNYDLSINPTKITAAFLKRASPHTCPRLPNIPTATRGGPDQAMTDELSELLERAERGVLTENPARVRRLQQSERARNLLVQSCLGDSAHVAPAYRHTMSANLACWACGSTKHLKWKFVNYVRFITCPILSEMQRTDMNTCPYPNCRTKAGHTIAVCLVLHSRCRSCNYRGHQASQCASKTVWEHLAIFELYANMGWYTAKRERRPEWGFFPIVYQEHFVPDICARSSFPVPYSMLIRYDPKIAAEAVIIFNRGVREMLRVRDEGAFAPAECRNRAPYISL